MQKSVLFLILVGLFSCTAQQAEIKVADLTLNSYQKKILNDYQVYEGVNVFADLDVIRYKVPKIEKGKITIRNPESAGGEIRSIMIFQHKKLTRFGNKSPSNTVGYDENGNVTKYLAWNAIFEDGKISKATNGASDWIFKHDGNCIESIITDKNSDYIAQKSFCFDDKNRLISLKELRNLEFSNVFKSYQYDSEMLVGKQYFETKGMDTISYTISKVDSIENGLIMAYSEQIKSRGITGSVAYLNEYNVLAEQPLSLMKRVFKNDKFKYEVRYSFNERGNLTEFFTRGKYGEKYVVDYEYQE